MKNAIGFSVKPIHKSTKYTVVCSWWENLAVFSHDYHIHRDHNITSLQTSALQKLGEQLLQIQ